MVKNVTGYDLHKLLIGSLGTLAVITRVNFRTFPLPHAQETFVASFATAEGAFEFCRAVAHSPLTPQIIEVADPGAGQLIFSGEASARMAPDQWSVIISAAGQHAVVDRYSRRLGRASGGGRQHRRIPSRQRKPHKRFILARIREFPRLILEAEKAGRGNFPASARCPSRHAVVDGEVRSAIAKQNYVGSSNADASIRDCVCRVCARRRTSGIGGLPDQRDSRSL